MVLIQCYLLFVFCRLLYASIEGEVSPHRYCEAEAMRVATRLVDIFNSYTSNSDWKDSYHCNYLTSHIAFDRDLLVGRLAGRTSEGQFAVDLRRAGGWMNDTDILKSSYWSLKDQWVYLNGDSTSRQLFEVLFKSYTDMDDRLVFKEWTESNVSIHHFIYCLVGVNLLHVMRWLLKVQKTAPQTRRSATTRRWRGWLGRTLCK